MKKAFVIGAIGTGNLLANALLIPMIRRINLAYQIAFDAGDYSSLNSIPGLRLVGFLSMPFAHWLALGHPARVTQAELIFRVIANAFFWMFCAFALFKVTDRIHARVSNTRRESSLRGV